MQPTAQVEVTPNTRQIVNSDFNTTNIVQMSEQLAPIDEVLDACMEVCKQHSGPTSGYAMLVNNFSAGTKFEPNFFTRDGIRILENVEFMSPLQRYIKDMLTYVGSRVDSAAKDGTTTSMWFTAAFLKHLLHNQEFLKNCQSVSMYQLNTVIADACERIIKIYDDQACKYSDFVAGEATDHNEQVAAGKVALMQALSSSGGDMELAYAMRDIFEASPKVTWDFITSYRSKRENGEPYKVEVDPFEARIRCLMTGDGTMNEALGTEYKEKDVKVLVFAAFIDDTAIKTDAIADWLARQPADQPISVIATGMGGRFTNAVAKINKQRQVPIYTWEYAPEQRLGGKDWVWELQVLTAIAGKMPYSDYAGFDDVSDAHVFTAKSLHWHDTYLDIDGIVPGGEEVTNGVHPFFAHPELATPYYSELLKAVTTQLEDYKLGHFPDGKTYNAFVQILNSLASYRRPTLRLGGPAHVQIANGDVVQDVQGATMSSLNNGFTVKGTLAWSHAFATAEAEIAKLQQAETDKDSLKFTLLDIERNIASGMKAAISTINDFLYTGKAYSKYTEAHEENNKLAYINLLDPDRCHTVGEFLATLPETVKHENLVNTMEFGSKYPVAQPVTIFHEVLRRIQELIIKFTRTDQIVVAGGVVVDKTDSKE